MRKLDALKEENQVLQGCVVSLEQSLQDEKTRFGQLWRTNCRCLVDYDAMVVAKDSEIEELKQQLRAQAGSVGASPIIASPLVVVASPQRGGVYYD